MPNPGSPYKDSLQLSVGVGLSAEQVAALTHDIVWLEEAIVNGEKVLVPVLYLAQAENRLGPTGALIQGQDVSLISGGALNNAGTLHASNNLSASASNLSNSGLIQAGNRLDLLADDSIRNAAGGIIAGRDVSLTALTGDVINERSVTRIDSAQSANRTWTTSFADSAARIEAANSLDISAGRDVSNLGGVLQSRGDLFIGADRDVNIASVEVTNGQLNGRRYYSETTTQLGAEASAGRDLDISAGRDLNAVASRLDAARDAALSAGRDVTLASAADESHSYSNTRKISSQKDHVEQQGTELTAGGDVSIAAGQDLALKASSVSASGEAYLYAGRDVSLVSEQDSDYSYYRKTKTSSSGLSSSTKTRVDSSSSTTQAGSLVSADKIAIRAGQDIAVQGSDVASTNGTSLLAGRNVLIDGATESFETSHAESKKKSGLMSSGGIGVTLGSSSLKTTQDDHTEQTRGSTIGSVLGNVDIQAGKGLTIRGSDLVAGKDINLIGQNVSILEAQNRNRSEETREQKKSGLTLALSGSVGSAVNTAYQSSKEARHEDDSRLAALKGIQAGLTGYQAWQAAEQGGMTTDNAGNFVGIAISLGSQQSKSKTVQEQSIGQGSTLTAGNNLNILATGAGKVGEDGDIRIQGSQLKAGQDVMLAANRDLILEAASNTQKLDGKNSSSGGNVGVSIGFGSGGGGLSVFANGNKGTGFEHGNGTTWTETTVDAGRQVTLVSGRDTSLIGAQVSGEQITAKVGRDLTLRSLQDTDEYKSEQKNVSGGVSVAIIGSGGSASLSVDKSKIHSNYDSVQEQTGLYAGKGGYDIDVGKHTQLDGAVISSTANADKNHLSTDTLGWRDIRNEADFKTQQQGATASSGGNEGGNFLGNAPNGMVTAYTHSDSDSGTTRSAISAGTIDIRNGEAQQQDVASLSRDVEHANGSISPIFDKEKEQRRLQEVQLIAQIGSQSMDIIRTNGEIKATKAGQEELDEKGTPRPGANATAKEIQDYNDALANTKAYQDVMREYGTGSNYQKAAQAVTAALQYLAGGDIGGAVAGASAPYVATLIKQQTGNNDTARIMAQAVLGAIVASAQGNSGVAGAAGAATGELIAQQLYPNKPHDQLTENERQIVSALSTLAAGMAGGLTSGDSAGAFAAAGAGKTAVENNDLGSRLYLDRKVEEFAAAGNCGGMSTESCRAKYAEKVFEEGGGANGVMLSVLMGVGAPVAAALGPELLMACIANPAVCTEASLAGAEVPFGAATAGGTALGMGGFGGLIGKEVSAGTGGAAKPTIELFGGKNAQTPGAINIDITSGIQSGIRADARSLPLRDSSVGEIVASNPFIPKSEGGTFSMMDYLPEATRVIEPGGKIFINSNAANPYGKLPSFSDLESLGLRVIQDGPLDARFSGQTFLRTDGSVITDLESMKTIVLEKIK
nr:hemagglutinin repeat-containing protein [Pseudomonas sp. PDM19]